jgi:hypothetical protein
MEYEQQKPLPTVKELLGSKRKQDEAEIGIIKETEHWIHLKAFDYLMVGFVTDVDQVEGAREQRHEAYVDTIEATFAEYREDVKKWDENHLLNIEPDFWQKQHDYERNEEIRRIDLPSIEVCRDSIVGPAARRIPTRGEIEHVASEGLNKFYDSALEASYTLLKRQLSDIEAELPTAPYEAEDGVKTQTELAHEQMKILSRISAIEKLSFERYPADTADNISILQPAPVSEIAPITAQIYVVRQIGGVGIDLVRTV